MIQNSRMPQSIARVLIHTVFSTKGRESAFHDPAFRSEVQAYLGGCAKTLDCLPIQIGGVADYVHLLTTLSRTLAIAEFVKEIKRVSTNWIQKRGGLFGQFHWQAGYGCFSVSESNLSAVSRYISRQEEHHRKITFQEEYRELLRRHGQTWDEAYVWD
jgi:REP element-mobilizing transposase RayT